MSFLDLLREPQLRRSPADTPDVPQRQAHPLSPTTMRGRQTDGQERIQTDRLAPPAPVSWHLDGEEAITAITDPGGWPNAGSLLDRLTGMVSALAYHLISLEERGDISNRTLGAIEEVIRGRDHIDTGVMLSTTPVQVSQQGRRHLFVWVSDALITSTQKVVIECGSYSHTLFYPGSAVTGISGGGWCQIDPPMGECRVSITSGANSGLYVYFRATDYPPLLAAG